MEEKIYVPKAGFPVNEDDGELVQCCLNCFFYRQTKEGSWCAYAVDIDGREVWEEIRGCTEDRWCINWEEE